MKHTVGKRILICVLVAALLITPVFASGGLSSAIAVVFGGSEGETQSAFERIMDTTGFVYGTNVPFTTVGNTLGTSGAVRVNGGSPTMVDNTENFRRMFTNVKAIGFNAVRLWLFTNMEGLILDDNGVVQGFEDGFLDNLDKTLQIAEDLDLAVDVTIQPHLDEAYKRINKHIYDVAMQNIVNPDTRKIYLEKAVIPACEVLKKHQKILLSVTTYCEPEMDTYAEYSGYIWGTSWDNVASFITDMAATLHEKLPGIPITACSGSDPYRAYKYNDMGLDLIGVDVYRNDGVVPDPKNSNVTKPMWMTEFGQDTSEGYNNSNDFHIANMMNFFTSALESGYVGGFYWYFNGTMPLSITYTKDTYSDLRPAAMAMHTMMLDLQYEHEGKTGVADAPAILYSDDPMYLTWLSSRDADTYTIEYSEDGQNYSVLQADILSDDVTDSNGVARYSLSGMRKQGVNYYFRVSVKTLDELTATSAVSQYFVPRYTCSDEDNLLTNGNFETGDISGWNWTGDAARVLVETEDTKSWTNVDHPVVIRGGYSAKVYTDLNKVTNAFSQTVTVKPNTVYHYYFYYWNGWSTSDLKFMDAANAKSFKTVPITSNVSGAWVQCNGEFTTDATTTQVKVNFSGYAGGATNFVYLDSFYFFED